jgi:hypothetical protein
MPALARETAPGAERFARLVLPDDAVPVRDAIVAVGHFSYLPDEEPVDRAFAAEALRPGGVLAVDICDLERGMARRDAPNLGRAGEDWAIITELSSPSPTRFVRQITVFVRNQDGSWRVTTNATTTCSSIPDACPGSSPDIRLMRPLLPHSVPRPYQSAFAP